MPKLEGRIKPEGFGFRVPGGSIGFWGILHGILMPENPEEDDQMPSYFGVSELSRGTKPLGGRLGSQP